MVGLNVTLIVQVAWPASDLPQLLVGANCPAAVPVSAMLVMATALGLVFVTVTDFAALVVLIGWLPKASERGVSVSTVPCSRYRPCRPCTAIGSVGHDIAKIVDEIAVQSG